MTYCIHSFMIGELGLKGNELLIYAIIYSFTCGDKGLFYGTQEFLSAASGISVSSIKRKLLSLLNKGYIEKSNDGIHSGYRSLKDGKKSSQGSPSADDMHTESNDIGKTGDRDKAFNKMKDEQSDSYIENTAYRADIYSSDETEDGYRKLSVNLLAKMNRMSVEDYLESEVIGKEKYEFIRVGRFEMFTMTPRQYMHLLSLVGRERLTDYIHRLESFVMLKNYTVICAYRTLKKWINEDTAL